MLIIKSRRKRPLGLNEPIRHGSHKRPVTRRDFLAQGFLTGAATVIAPTMLAALLNPRRARALSPDIVAMKGPCNITDGTGKIPFICIDLAGGANIAGSNVLVGFEGGQLDPLSTQGYSKLGLPGDMLPTSSTGNFVNTELGLAFHSDSAFLRGILETTTPTTRARVNGAIIPARSENDTGNNPHNPMYGIAKYGAKGELLTLIGSQNSDSGGNSIAPAMLIDLENRPTKIDRRSDVTGLVDIGEVARILSVEDTVLAMESMVRISNAKMALPTVRTGTADEDDLKRRFTCSYVKTADTIEEFGARGLDPFQDPEITSIPVFGPNLLSGDVDGEFEKTASVMKLVIEGYAGAGTISMGGYDYHTGDRAAGEIRDLRAGRCMGACLEYAARRGKPLMLYVFSDGSVSSNGRVDDSADGRGKGEWTSDNQQTAASFFLVYSPLGRPTLLEENNVPIARRQQIGYFRRSGDVETIGSPAANNVNLLVQTVVLNYMALHEASPNLSSVIPGHGLGDVSTQRSLIAFNPIVTGPV
jgi:hypothetical protein